MDSTILARKIIIKLLNGLKNPVIIGDNCWLGQDSRILKNAHPNNTIVGNSAIVTKKFEQEHTILARNPAKVIKENVTWDRKTPARYT